MRHSTEDGNIYDDTPDPLQHQYNSNAYYSASTNANEASSSNFSYEHFAPNTPQHDNSSSAYNVHQQRQLELQRTFALPQGLRQRNTLPSANLNSSLYYPTTDSNHDTEHRVASYPSSAYSGHLSGQFNTLSADRVPDWFINPPNFDPGGYHRSSTLSNSSFATSAARNSGTSFATSISTRSSLVSNDTYAPNSYEDFPSSVYVKHENDTATAQPTVASAASAALEGSVSDPGRPFQCTYHCGKTFAKRHEWKRHEDSIHESQWKYICKPELLYPGMICQFCQCVADHAHLELNHQNRLCQELDDKSKHTFTRKDKFQLHVHSRHCPNHKAKKQWQKWAHPTDPRSEGYGCGFCNEHLPSWNVRAKHIGDHFEKDAPRLTMDRWDVFYDVGTYGRDGQTQTSTFASTSQTTPPNNDFYAESKALSDGESQTHTPPDSRYSVPRKRSVPRAVTSNNRSNRPNRRLFYEEEDTQMEDDGGGETLFGDDMDYIE